MWKPICLVVLLVAISLLESRLFDGNVYIARERAQKMLAAPLPAIEVLDTSKMTPQLLRDQAERIFAGGGDILSRNLFAAAAAQAEEENDFGFAAQNLLSCAQLQLLALQPEAAEETLQKALKLARKANQREVEDKILFTQVSIAHESRSDNGLALARERLDCMRKTTKNPAFLWPLQNDLAWFYRNRKAHANAYILIREACENMDKTAEVEPRLRSSVHTFLAMESTELGHYQEGLQAALAAVSEAQLAGEQVTPDRKAFALKLAGSCAVLTKNYPVARECFARLMADEQVSRSLRQRAVFDLACCEFASGNLAQAERTCLPALTETNLGGGRCRQLMLLRKIYQTKGKSRDVQDISRILQTFPRIVREKQTSDLLLRALYAPAAMAPGATAKQRKPG